MNNIPSGAKFDIDLLSLYQALGGSPNVPGEEEWLSAQYGSLAHCGEEDPASSGGYCDFYDWQRNLCCCDGETVEVVETSDTGVVTLVSAGSGNPAFMLSAEEFKVAAHPD